MAKDNEITPSANGDNGLADARDGRGRFLRGNPGGPGNPHAAAVNAWRSALFNALTDDDVRKVIRVLIAKAEAGEPWAVRELLDRCMGKPDLRVGVEGRTWEDGVRALEAMRGKRGE
jgi:hypothetical protein